jgi:hypothetical protein
MKILIKLIIYGLSIVPLVAVSQGEPDASQADAPKPSPCEQDARFHEFDFWVGEWDVHDADGNFVGENSITRAERGCVLVEKWRGAKGSTGISMNYVDKIRDEWVQIWHAGAGYQLEIRGGLTDEGMLLAGQVHYIGSGQTAPFRGLWTPLPDGRVRQYFEQSNDDGATWQPWFEGFYSRKSTD